MTFFTPARHFAMPRTTHDAIMHLGLGDGLHVSLDASDAKSYPGSGTVWYDLMGNVDFDFFNSPTFSGNAGGQSANEYFTVNGANGFVGHANTAAIDSLHHNASQFSWLMWFYIPGASLAQALRMWNTANASSQQGVELYRLGSASAPQSIEIDDTDGGSAQANFGSTNATLPGWNFVGAGVSISSPNWTVNMNAGTRKQNGIVPPATVSPGSGNASQAIRIGYDTVNFAESGVRFASFHLWEGVMLTWEQFDVIRAMTAPKFGTS